MEAQLFDLPVATGERRLSWEEEEFLDRMTLQICMIGSDGFVLASDRLSVSMAHHLTTTTFQSEKIYFNHDWSAAWCASGYSCTDVICQDLQSALQDSKSSTPRTIEDIRRHLYRL